MQVFKVVEKTKDNHYYSVVPHQSSLKYLLNENIVPIVPNSKIFCFLNIHDAIDFCKSNRCILLCVTENQPIKLNYRIDLFDPTYILDFWNRQNFGPYLTRETPTGTYGVDSLTPIKELTDEEIERFKKSTTRG